MAKISPARMSAAEILRKIETERAFSSILLPAHENELSDLDRALCHELTLGVLRRQIFLDRVIEWFTRKDIGRFDTEVAVALRLGLYQIYFLDRIPAYSAINESVNLVRHARKSSAAGLVNAVLRRASRETPPLLDFESEAGKISVESSHPQWLVEHWIDQFGIETAGEIAKANNIVPRMAFRMTARFYRQAAEYQQRVRDDIEELMERRSELLDGCFIIERSDKRLIELSESGDIYFQDEGSQLVSSLVDLQPGESFLDVCSAPGSKITYISGEIAKRNRNDGEVTLKKNLLVAGDFYAHRLRQLTENTVRQGIAGVSILRYDAEQAIPFPARIFDAVLVDAPCSGTGTIRHNPEIRYFLQKNDFRELARKQLNILRNASKLVKRGGRLIYSTCSLEMAENEEVVKAFLIENREFDAVRPDLPAPLQTADGFARTFPHRDGIDGFFIAVFEKRKSIG